MKRITLIVIWKREAFKVFFLLCSFFSTLLLKANEGDPMKHKKDSLLGLLSKQNNLLNRLEYTTI